MLLQQPYRIEVHVLLGEDGGVARKTEGFQQVLEFSHGLVQFRSIQTARSTIIAQAAC